MFTFSNCRFLSIGDLSLRSNSKLLYGGILGGIITSNSSKIKIESCSNTDTNHIQLTATGYIYAGGVIGEAKKSKTTITDQTCLINITVDSSSRFYVGGMIGCLNAVDGSLTLTDGVIAGNINYTEAPSIDSYIGTIYGYGRLGVYVLSYNISGLNNFPANSGNVHTGNPTGRQT